MKKYNVELTEGQIDDIWGILAGYQYEVEQEIKYILEGGEPDTQLDDLIYRLNYVKNIMEILHNKSLEIQGF